MKYIAIYNDNGSLIIDYSGNFKNYYFNDDCFYINVKYEIVDNNILIDAEKIKYNLLGFIDGDLEVNNENKEKIDNFRKKYLNRDGSEIEFYTTTSKFFKITTTWCPNNGWFLKRKTKKVTLRSNNYCIIE